MNFSRRAFLRALLGVAAAAALPLGALFSQRRVTLADLAARADPSVTQARIAEILNQTNPMLDDIPWIPSTMPLSHRSTMKTKLPAVVERAL